MISAGEFRNGITLEYKGDIYTIIDFQHVKPGKGAAFVRSKLKNIVTGSILEETFRPTEKMARAHIERSDMQYLYNEDGDIFHFMDNETYEQTALNASEVGDALKYVRENDVVKFMSYNGKVFGIEPAMFAELRVTQTEPGFAGDSAKGVTKPAIVETGAQISVPLFVNIDDIVKIDTRTDEYLGRVQK